MVARSFNLIGPGMPESQVAGALCKQFSDPKLGEIEAGNTTPIRDFVDVRDAVRAYWMLLEQGASGAAYNICSNKPVSIESLISLFQQQVSRNVSVRIVANRVRDIDSDVVFGSYKKLHDLTGWMPQISLRQSVADMLEYAAK